MFLNWITLGEIDKSMVSCQKALAAMLTPDR